MCALGFFYLMSEARSIKVEIAARLEPIRQRAKNPGHRKIIHQMVLQFLRDISPEVRELEFYDLNRVGSMCGHINALRNDGRKTRNCLRCRKPFPSSGPENRVCLKCVDQNQRLGFSGRDMNA